VLLAVKLGLARLPENANFLHMAGLAFEEEMARFANESRLGILFGSGAAGLAGYLFLRLAARS
jgi:Na+/H+ antiporter NhaA